MNRWRVPFPRGRPRGRSVAALAALSLLVAVLWGTALAPLPAAVTPVAPARAASGAAPRVPAAGVAATRQAVLRRPAGNALVAPPRAEQGAVRGWLARGFVALLLLPGAVWVILRPREVNRIDRPGFEIISPSQRRVFIPLEDKFQAMDFLSRVPSTSRLRLSANLNKVTLSIRRYGYLMEDKNYRNALLVNRRRVRRTLLRDGDVLDLGELTLLYRDNRQARLVRHAPVTPPEGKAVIKFQRTRGPVRKGMPMLVPEQVPNRVFYVTKNLVYLGRSENNDLVIKSQGVSYRHAKIERVGGRYKLQDLSGGTTTVNNRRIEQRYLKDGDEIGIENQRFRFTLATRATRERPLRQAGAGGAERPPQAEEQPEANGDDEGDDQE